ncbi:uncharacterized protein LOC144599806 isoform X4 [Rhinoraja longicauda]
MSAWKPLPLNSLATKGFRSVRPKFLTSARKPALQQNGKVDTKERNDNPRTEDCLSSRNSNQETSSMRAQSSIPRDNETDFKDKEVNTSDSEMDLHPAYKITLQTAGQKMTTANVLPATAAMTSEKGASPLITEKVPSDVMPKTWYTSMIKDDHSIPKADDDGWPSYTDAKREPNVTNQSFPSSAAVLTSRNDWALHKGNIDTSSGHAEAGNVCAFEDRWSSVSHHSCQFQKPTRNATLVDSVLHRTGSVPAVKASTSHLAIQDPVPRSHTSPGTDTDPCSEIRRDSTKLISVDIENDANLNRPTQKQKPQEEISDPKQQLNMEWITRAKYDFHGQTSKELAVKKGDSVFIHRQRDDNWYVAECNGNRGLLPVCYVEPPSEFQPHDNTMDEIAIAKFRFVALTNIELPLEKNQLVVLLRRIDENWYEGKVPGTDHKGIFPVAYVEVIGKPAGDYICHRDHTPTPASHLNLEVASQRSFHQLHQRRMNYDNVQLGGEIYLALYSFVPHKHDELELRQGDRIKVIKKCDDGWYLGTSIRTKKFGTFPGNYVRKFESV